MKTMVGIIFLLSIAVSGYSKYYDILTPSERETLSGDWLGTGKAYYDSKKTADAKDSFYYVIELYPMGDYAKEAAELLKKHFRINIRYNPEKQFSFYVKKAAVSVDDMIKINYYLMALEIKDDKKIDKTVSDLLKKTGSTDESQKYLELSQIK